MSILRDFTNGTNWKCLQEIRFDCGHGIVTFMYNTPKENNIEKLNFIQNV